MRGRWPIRERFPTAPGPELTGRGAGRGTRGCRVCPAPPAAVPQPPGAQRLPQLWPGRGRSGPGLPCGEEERELCGCRGQRGLGLPGDAQPLPSSEKLPGDRASPHCADAHPERTKGGRMDGLNSSTPELSPGGESAVLGWGTAVGGRGAGMGGWLLAGHSRPSPPAPTSLPLELFLPAAPKERRGARGQGACECPEFHGNRKFCPCERKLWRRICEWSGAYSSCQSPSLPSL